jgi:hypothetical protein
MGRNACDAGVPNLGGQYKGHWGSQNWTQPVLCICPFSLGEGRGNIVNHHHHVGDNWNKSTIYFNWSNSWSCCSIVCVWSSLLEAPLHPFFLTKYLPPHAPNSFGDLSNGSQTWLQEILSSSTCVHWKLFSLKNVVLMIQIFISSNGCLSFTVMAFHGILVVGMSHINHHAFEG